MGIRTSNSDLTNNIKDPYNKQHTVMVDKLLGSAYDVVRLVAENIEYVKHTSYYLKFVIEVEGFLKEIKILADNIDNFKDLFSNIEGLRKLYQNLDQMLNILQYIPEIQNIHENIQEILKVASSINNLDSLADNLDVLINLQENLSELLKIKGYAEQIALDKDSVDKNTSNVKSIYTDILEKYEDILEKYLAVTADTQFVRDNISKFEINVAFINKATENSRIYAESAYFFAEDSRMYARVSKGYNDNLEKYKVYYYGALTSPPENAPVGAEYIDISRKPAIRMLLLPEGWFPAYPSYRIEYTNNTWKGVNVWDNAVTFNSFAQFNQQTYFNNYAIFLSNTLFYEAVQVGSSTYHLNGDSEGIIWDGKLSEFIKDYQKDVQQEFAERDNNLITFKDTLGKLAYKDKIIPTDIGTEGTPSNLTFLRGDGQWVTITRSSLSGGKDILDYDNIFKGNVTFINEITVGDSILNKEGNIISDLWGGDLKSYIDNLNNESTKYINTSIEKVKEEISSLKNDIKEDFSKVNTDIENLKEENNDFHTKICNILYGTDTLPTENTQSKIAKDLLKSNNTWTGINSFSEKLTVSELFSNGEVSAFSDITLKENLKTIPKALDKVNALQGYSYFRKDLGINQTGVIAQEIQKVLPDAVKEQKNNLLSVDYNQIIPLLLESIKELSKKVDELSEKK